MVSSFKLKNCSPWRSKPVLTTVLPYWHFCYSPRLLKSLIQHLYTFKCFTLYIKPLPFSQATQPTAKVSAKVEEERKDESPASWRLGLRKTGSYGALAEITATKEAQREKDTTGVMRSASSPRLSSSLDNKDKEKVNSHIVTSFILKQWAPFMEVSFTSWHCVYTCTSYSIYALCTACIWKGRNHLYSGLVPSALLKTELAS